MGGHRTVAEVVHFFLFYFTDQQVVCNKSVHHFQDLFCVGQNVDIGQD